MPIPVLPKLHEDHNVAQFDGFGGWDSRDADELKNISEGLDVNSQVQTQINSIPDVWARPLLFEMALFNSAHPLHPQILGEWRGLLAMLALREVKNLTNLTARLVEIIDEDSQPEFLRALHRLKPKGRSVSPDDTDWDYMYLFLYKVGHLTSPVGMTSPTTLVFTSSHYANHINRNEVSWFNGKILQDPINLLSNQEKQALYGWIEEMTGEEGKLTVRSHELHEILWQNLAEQLKNFQRALNSAGSFSAGSMPFGIQGARAGVFIHLNTPAAEPRHVPDASQVRLIASADRNPAVPMLIVDRGIAEQWQENNPANVVVSGAATLASIPQNGLIERHKIGSHTINNAELWKPDELLTPKLYVIRQKDAFTGARNEEWVGNPPVLGNDAVSVILPVNEKLLEYFNEDELLQRLKFNQGANEEITVTLDLPLAGNGVHNSYLFRKTYSRENIVDYEDVPILEVFPNFKSDSWRAYFVAYSAVNPRTTFKVKPFAPHAEEARIAVHGNANAERMIWRLDSYPQALICYQGQEKAGLLLLKNPDYELPPANRSFTVGIDFGASGTTVYKSLGNDKKPVEFKKRKLTVTAVDPAQEPQVFDFFLPNRDIPAPFLSFFQLFNNHPQNILELAPLLHGHTYYTDDERLGELQQQENVKTNLKWSNDKIEKLCAKAFLAQICLQTAAELVCEGAQSIDWRFSYPTALANPNDYLARCGEIAAEIANLTGVTSNNSSHNTESVAAATFFQAKETHDAQTKLGTIFVDIGSSTSDISVWQENTLRWQISLPLAGRDIFLDYLYSNPSVREELKLPAPRSADGSASERERFYAAIHAFLRKDNEEIFKRLSFVEQEHLTKLRNHLALGLSGLFYYIGLGIRCLRDGDRYTEAEMPHFYFGGNGSQIFRWLSDGTWTSKNNPYHDLFEFVFKKAVNEDLKNYLKIEMSGLPKKEAAYGLVCDAILSVPDNSHQIVFAGENFKENGNLRQWSDAIDETILTDSIKPTDTLKILGDFVLAFNEFANTSNGQIRRVNFDAQKMADVRSRLANDLARLAHQRAQEQAVVVQPIFILALKHLLSH